MDFLDLVKIDRISQAGHALTRADFIGKTLFAYDLCFAENSDAFYGVAKFAEISWPGIIVQRCQCLRTEPLIVSVIAATEKKQHIVGAGFNIFLSLTQRRDLDFHHIQAVVKIFPKSSLGNGFAQVEVGGGDKPYIGIPGDVFADPFVFLFLDEAQEFGLDRQGQVADLIQEERAFLAQ